MALFPSVGSLLRLHTLQLWLSHYNLNWWVWLNHDWNRGSIMYDIITVFRNTVSAISSQARPTAAKPSELRRSRASCEARNWSIGMFVGRDVTHQELCDVDWSLGYAIGSQLSWWRQRDSARVSLAVTIASLFGMERGESRRLTFVEGTAISWEEDSALFGTKVSTIPSTCRTRKYLII